MEIWVGAAAAVASAVAGEEAGAVIGAAAAVAGQSDASCTLRASCLPGYYPH